MKFFDEFAKRDFKMWYQNMDGIKRPMKTETIVEQLDITAEEMAQFDTIIDGREKYARKVNKRRESGIKPREEYLQEQQQKSDDKLTRLRQLLEVSPELNKTELAKKLDIHRSHLYRLLKQL